MIMTVHENVKKQIHKINKSWALENRKDVHMFHLKTREEVEEKYGRIDPYFLSTLPVEERPGSFKLDVDEEHLSDYLCKSIMWKYFNLYNRFKHSFSTEYNPFRKKNTFNKVREIMFGETVAKYCQCSECRAKRLLDGKKAEPVPKRNKNE